MSILCEHRTGKASAAIVTASSLVGDNRPLLYTRWRNPNSTSWCLRDYFDDLELRGKADGRTINDIEKVLTATGASLDSERVNTKNGVAAWKKHLTSLGGGSQTITSRGAGVKPWRRLRVNR